MNLSRAVMEERNQKDIAVQQALAQARAEMQEKLEVGQDEKNLAYPVAWTQQGHTMEVIMSGEQDDSDKEKE